MLSNTVGLPSRLPIAFHSNLLKELFESISKLMFRLKPLVLNRTPFINWEPFQRSLKKRPLQKERMKSRRLGFVLLVGGCAIGNILYTSPHGSQIDSVKDYYEHYSEDKPTVIRPKLQQLILECMKDIGLSEEEKILTKCVIANVYEQPRSYGYLYGKVFNRVLVLLPQFFNHQSEEDFDKKNMSEAIPFQLDLSENSQEYRQFQNSLMLSDEAKKFAIARELQRSKKGYHRLNAAMGVLMACTTYLMCRVINTQFGLLKGPRSARVVAYISLAVTHFVMFYYSSKYMKNSQETEFDEAVARISKSYARGGVELYLKETARHLYIRQNVTNSDFDRYGDKVPWFGPYLPLEKRMARCRHIMALHDADLA